MKNFNQVSTLSVGFVAMRFCAFAAVLATAVGLLACGGSNKNAKSGDDTVVPQSTQERSEQNYGQQQGMMEDLNATSADQAAARHDAAVRDVRDPDDED